MLNCSPQGPAIMNTERKMMHVKNIPFRESTIAVASNDNVGRTAVVFIHGNSMSGKIWGRQFDSTLGDRYHLIAPDLPGHGESGNLEIYDLGLLSECITAVVDAGSLNDYVLVGNSLGGDLILQEIGVLKGCKGIMLCGTPPVSKPPAMEKAFLHNPIVGMLFQKEY